MAGGAADALKYARDNRDRVLSELREFLSIPSVSSSPTEHEDVTRATEWLADRLRAAGLPRVEVFPTKGHSVVYGETAEAGPSAPTVLIYGHYDVQSAAPLGDWNSDPYRPTVRGDELFGRGVADNKGPMMATVSAVESAIRADSLAVNVKFVIEGEEELGSPHFGDFLNEQRELLSGDFVLNSDVGMLAPDLPTIYCGLRGMYVCKLRIKGPVRDLHSGSFGGIVHNPIHVLSDVVSGLHDADGRVTLEGFYDRVREITAAEKAEIASLPRDEESYLAESGVSKLWGETGFAPAEREGFRPALDVVHVLGGSLKSAIPATADAMITVRLVPDQDPDQVHSSLMSYLGSRVPDTAAWEVTEHEGFPASLTDRESSGVRALAGAMEEVWGRKPVFCRSGGSIAAVGQIQEILGLDSVLTGFALPDAQTHGPNEKLHLPTWGRGIDALIHFLHLLGGSR
jgi:acetylornithine deacetylase/succinyl-diaminopimelate desuccinylase-like protein